MITKIWYSFKILVFTFWNNEILLNLLHINLSAVYVWNSLRDVVMEPSHSSPFWAHTGARLSLGLFSCDILKRAHSRSRLRFQNFQNSCSDQACLYKAWPITIKDECIKQKEEKNYFMHLKIHQICIWVLSQTKN